MFFTHSKFVTDRRFERSYLFLNCILFWQSSNWYVSRLLPRCLLAILFLYDPINGLYTTSCIKQQNFYFHHYFLSLAMNHHLVYITRSSWSRLRPTQNIKRTGKKWDRKTFARKGRGMWPRDERGHGDSRQSFLFLFLITNVFFSLLHYFEKVFK